RNFSSHEGEPLLEAGDLDRDGDLDLAAGARDQTKLRTLLNGGKGDFSSAADLEVELEFPLFSLALGDLDGGGLTDAACTGLHCLRLKNAGAGPLTPAGTLRLGPLEFATVLTKDLDGDQALDIVVVEGACPDFMVFLNDGRGSFPIPMSVTAGTSP